MVAVDERPERRALRQLSQPVNFGGAGEGLNHAEDGEQESEDRHDAHDQPQAFGAVNEGERGGKIDYERANLDEREPRRKRIERKTVDRRSRKRRGRLRLSSDWQKLNESEQD